MDDRFIPIIVVFLFVSVIVGGEYVSFPECLLVEQDVECPTGYYAKQEHNCFSQIKLKQCCSGQDYLLKGVYGDKTCWYVMQGQPRLN